jgi:thioredoxin-dependent peroxiredoxin
MAKKKAKSKSKTKPKKKTKVKAVAKKTKKPARTKAKPKAKAKTKSKAKPKAVVGTPASVTSAPQTLPNIEVQTTNGGRVRLSDLKGKNVVLYFYPKDDTPGCTTEGCDIRDRYAQFQQKDTVVYGVSRDGVDSHEKFKAKFGFPFELIADPDEKLCRSFGVIQKKSLYGKEYMGVDRSTFVYGKDGKLRKEFRSVKVEGHADELLNVLNQG